MRRDELRTPCFVIEEAKLRRNGRILAELRRNTGCRILLAQKCFSNWELYPLLAEYLDGSEASGLYEARLGHEKFPGECHVFSAAFRDDEFDELLGYADHIVFNSLRQLQKFGERAKTAGLSVGLRVNPEHSTQVGHEIYDPCAPGSRLGVTADELSEGGELLRLLDGIHFHTLCEQDSDSLEETLDAVEEKFGYLFGSLKWINFGGGHHITREGYDLMRLESCILRIRDKYGLDVYLEPGEAVALNAGVLITSVLDVSPSDRKPLPYAILDTSAACHMPDVLEMPYRPPLFNSGEPDEYSYTYRLGSQTCLAGDIIGDYSFEHELHEGDRLTFGDMAIYTMVKTNTFNGMPLPDIYVEHEDGECELLRRFGYDDFFGRL
ncbi:MAG TPA: carboxynorspermidine decarboxylase [Firmicutes bacterium]|nr:carboxynorspermidine decarboxylase [Bacillota bacterium]